MQLQQQQDMKGDQMQSLGTTTPPPQQDHQSVIASPPSVQDQPNQPQHQQPQNGGSHYPPQPSQSRPQSQPQQSPHQPQPTAISWRKGRLIGQGAVGKVFVGFDSVTGKLVAGKEFTFENIPNLEAKLNNLKQEIKIMKNLNHESIVKYIGADKHGKTFYIFMEYVPGGSLRDLLEEFGAFSELVTSRYTLQILRGLEYLHAKDVVHHDIKCANVLVGVSGQVKLSDFGSAHHFDDGELREMRGTAYWMAPEVIRGEGVSFAADIWSLGCTVLEMLTGKNPLIHLGNGFAVMTKVGNTVEEIPLPDEDVVSLSPNAKEFVRACLNKDASLRPTARELMSYAFVTDDDMYLQSLSSFATNAGPPSGVHTQASGLFGTLGIPNNMQPPMGIGGGSRFSISSHPTHHVKATDVPANNTSATTNTAHLLMNHTTGGNTGGSSPYSSISLGSWARGGGAQQGSGVQSSAGGGMQHSVGGSFISTTISDQHHQSILSRAMSHGSAGSGGSSERRITTTTTTTTNPLMERTVSPTEIEDHIRISIINNEVDGGGEEVVFDTEADRVISVTEPPARDSAKKVSCCRDASCGVMGMVAIALLIAVVVVLAAVTLV